MALPTQAQLAAIDAASGGTASVPLTAEQQQIVTLGQSQSTSSQTVPGPVPYNAPVFTQDQLNQNLSASQPAVGTPGSDQAGPPEPTAPSNTESPAALATDDNFGLSNTTSGTTVLLNAGTNPGSLITPQPNILDRYASYTYNLGWYLLSPTQFAEITNTEKLDVSQWSLLVQSGGAAIQQTGVSQQNTIAGQITSATNGRNKYFTLDYYMDDLEISTTLGGGGPATLTEISFKVTEPNGITLLPNLTNAVRDLYQETTAANNLAFYVMVVKFYGWDINGLLITDPAKNTGTVGATPGISNAVVTRYYPFQITEFNFKMANKAIEYQIKGTPQHFQYASSSGTASVPYNIELTGETVSDVLAGNGVFAVPDATDGRESSSTPSAAVQTAPSIKSQVSPTALMATGADTNVTTEQGVAFNLLSG